MSCTACPTIARPVKAQIELWDPHLFRTPKAEVPNLLDYDYYVVCFSGGKDSLACVLALLEAGVPKAKLELMHHEVDGREEDGTYFMDWPCTAAYCRSFAAAFGIPLYFSWREGGFRREMLRDGTPTAPTHFETPDGEFVRGGGGAPGKRKMFP